MKHSVALLVHLSVCALSDEHLLGDFVVIMLLLVIVHAKKKGGAHQKKAKKIAVDSLS